MIVRMRPMLGCFAFAFILLNSVTSAAFASDLSSYKSFVEYCQDPELDQRLKNTVRALKDAVAEDDCTAADTALKELDELILYSENLSMLEPIATFTQLKVLNLSRNPILDVAPLAALTKLELLNMHRTPLAATANLGKLTSLRALDISRLSTAGSYEAALDLSVLSGLTKLVELNVSRNAVTGFGALESLTTIKYLDISELSGVADFSPVAKLSKLVGLVMRKNNLKGAGFLAELTKLRGLDVSHNKKLAWSDIAALKGLYALTISHAGLSSLDVVKDLADLEQLSASHNAIVDLSPVAGKAYLTHLNVSHNAIESLAPIKSLPKLRKLGMRYNPLGTTIEKSADNCPKEGEGINEAVADFCGGDNP